jgi:hypothetical protein
MTFHVKLWWLRPWSTALLLRAANKNQRDMIDRQRAVNDQLFRDNRDLADGNAELRRQLANTTAPRGSGRALIGYEQSGGAKPEFVIVGIDRGAAGGKRIYASRDLGAPSFGAEEGRFDSAMKLITFMARMLVIDKPTYGEALARMAEIWANWDRDDKPALPQRRPQTAPRPDHGGWISGPSMTRIDSGTGPEGMWVGPPESGGLVFLGGEDDPGHIGMAITHGPERPAIENKEDKDD